MERHEAACGLRWGTTEHYGASYMHGGASNGALSCITGHHRAPRCAPWCPMGCTMGHPMSHHEAPWGAQWRTMAPRDEYHGDSMGALSATKGHRCAPWSKPRDSWAQQGTIGHYEISHGAPLSTTGTHAVSHTMEHHGATGGRRLGTIFHPVGFPMGNSTALSGIVGALMKEDLESLWGFSSDISESRENL